MEAAETQARLEDPDLPAIPVLLGPSAAEAMGKAVADAGGTIQWLEADYASYRPGRRLVVSYDAGVAWPDGSATEEVLVAVARRDGPPRTSLPVSVAGSTVGVWRLPDDPYLPGLRRAMDPGFVRDLLDELGAPPGPVEVRRRGYWPRARAVVEVTTRESEMKLVFRPGQGLVRAPAIRLLYLKVVTPEDGERIHRVHQELAGTLPVPACPLWVEDEGILVLEARPGGTLYDAVLDRAPVPDGRDLLALLDQLAEHELPGERDETVTEIARRYVPVLKALVPQESERIEGFIERLGDDSDEPLVPTHGDFHEYQVLVSEGRITGLLDVDDASPGHRIDDLAMMAGRFWSFSRSRPDAREELERYAIELLRIFGEVVDPQELHRRIAAVLFTRATSPFRDQLADWRSRTAHNLRVAEQWLERPVVRP